jgi:hypothetical protein
MKIIIEDPLVWNCSYGYSLDAIMNNAQIEGKIRDILLKNSITAEIKVLSEVKYK